MFSPMSVGAYIYKSIVHVGPTEEEDGEADHAKREDATEKEDSGSDSDGGTSADPPGLKTSLKRTAGAKETDVPSIELEIIASDAASKKYSARTDEFSAKLAALPEAEISDDDQMTSANVIMDDGGGASKVLHGSVITLPGDIPTTINPAFKTDAESAELDSALGDNLQLNDIGKHMPHRDTDIDEPHEQGEMEVNSDSNSDSYSSTNSDETATTVRENTENFQFEPEDQNDFGENNDSWPNQEETEHVYIAPDLEFPFYKTTVEIEQTVNVAEILDNMDKRGPAELPKQKEEKYIPRPISDDELENALKILRSGKHPPKRSWCSLDNISTSKPNRAFALYYKDRRGSAGDENEPSSPQGNGIMFGLTAAANKKNPIIADEHLRDDSLYIPNEPSNGEFAMPSPAFSPQENRSHEDEGTWKEDNMYTQRTPSNEYFAMLSPQSPPERIAFEGPSKCNSVSLSSPKSPTIPEEDFTLPARESASEEQLYYSEDEQQGGNSDIPSTSSHENAAVATPYSTPKTFAFVDPQPAIPHSDFPIEPEEDSTGQGTRSAPIEIRYKPQHRRYDNGDFPSTSHVDVTLPSSEPTSEENYYQPVDENQGAGSYIPSTPPNENAAFPAPESKSDSFESVDPPAPSVESPNDWDRDSALPGPELAPAPIAFFYQPKLSPGSSVELSPPPPPDELRHSQPIPGTTPQWAMPSAPETCPQFKSSFEFAAVATKEYLVHETPDDLPPPPPVEYKHDVKDDASDNVNDTNPSSEPSDSPMFPEPYISASIKHPKLFHHPLLQADPNDIDAEAAEFPGRKIEEDEQHPVYSMKQKESALIGLEGILLEKKSYPALPPKPNLLKPKPNLLKQKAVEKNPISPSLVSRKESLVDLSSLELNQPGDAIQDDSPMSPEPYISASVKLPTVFCMPPLGSPVSLKAQPSYRGNVVEDEQFPVFSKVQKELALAELENIVPQRKVPPKVPPKPCFKRRQQVQEPALVSTEVKEVKCAVDFSVFGQNKPSEVTSPEPKFLSKTLHPKADEERNEKDETVVGDDVVIMQAGISVYREEPEEFFPAVGYPPSLTRSESLQISDTGDMSYIQRDETLPPDETPAEVGNLQDGPVQRSPSREMVGMSARLSLHRLESGERFTETVESVHEQDIELKGNQSSSSESENAHIFVGTNDDDKNTVDDLFGSERDDHDSFSAEERYHPTDSFSEAQELYHGASVPGVASYSDHFESPEYSSSADEFVTEANITISKMTAAINAHNLKDISSSSSSSSDDSSGSSDSDDSSFESAEEHTYIVTESGDGTERDYYDNQEHDVISRSTLLPRVIEEGEEDELEEESSGDREDDSDGNDDHNKEEEDVKNDNGKEPEEEKAVMADDDSGENTNNETREQDEITFDQEVAPPLEESHVRPEELDTKTPSVIPVEVPRYPKYVNYDRPKYNTPPEEEEYEFRQPFRNVSSKTSDKTSERLSPPHQSPETYSPDDIETNIQDDVQKESDTSDESDSSEESSTHLSDVEQDVSDDREYVEETIDLSSEYSDEPEWQPPPPSSGARVFVLTSNVQYPVKVEPSRDLVIRTRHQPEDDLQFYETRDSNLKDRDPKDAADDETVRDTVREDDRQEADKEEYRKYEAEFEPEKYFRPINEVALTASQITHEEHARPIPQYSNEARYEGPEAEVPRDASPSKEQKNNKQGVRTVTVTYTVIHTKPTVAENFHRDETHKADGTVDSCDPLPGNATKPDEQHTVTDKSSPQFDAYKRHLKHIGDDIPRYNTKPNGDHPPSNINAESPQSDDFRYQDESYRENIPDVYHVQHVNAEKVESSVPRGSAIGNFPSYATDLDHYEAMYKNAPAESEEREDDRRTERTPEETSTPQTSDTNHDDVGHQTSKSIPVNEVGPYNYNTHPDQPREKQLDSRETTVKKIELSREVSLFEISSKEQRSPQRKPTSPDTVTATPTDDAEETGSYRFSSWYEEPSDDVPAMAIALVKSDIRLPSELISERQPVKRPDPKPKPLKPPIINTNRSSGKKPEEGPYKYTSWYEDPSEEKPNKDDDVIIVSSIKPKQESSPKKETPLSPDVVPGTYKYAAWFEEPAKEPSGAEYFVLSTPAADEKKSKSDSLNAPTSPVKEPGRYKYSALYEEPTDKPSKEDYFVVSTPSAEEERSNSASSKSKDSDEILKQGLFSRSALYEHYQPAAVVEDPSATFVISRPYEETELRPPDGSERPTRRVDDDLYYPCETHTNRHVTDTSGKNLSVGGSVSDASSRKNSYGSSRTSGSLADVSATSGEAMRRKWSDESDEFHGEQNSSAFSPPAVLRVTQLPPKPKPRKARPSAPSSSDDEQKWQSRRPGRGDGKGQETKADVAESLSPSAEYALASSAWRQITVREPSHQTSESVVWDSEDDKGKAIPGDRSGHDKRYSVPDTSRREIENMLDSLVQHDDAFDMPYNRERQPRESPRTVDNTINTTQWRHDASRSMNILPQTQNRSYEFVETSFQESRFHSTSEPHIQRGFDQKAAKGQHPEFAEPISSLRTRVNEPSKITESRERRPLTRGDTDDGPSRSRDEYTLAAASWENMSSASEEGHSKRTKMETWDNDPDFGSKRMEHPTATIGQQRHQPERAPSSSEDAYVPPRAPRVKGNGSMVTADVHAPYVQPPVPGDPQLALHMLSASASIAELAPPPPKDLGTPRKAYSTLGISQLAPHQQDLHLQTVMPDAEANIPRRRHRPPGKGPRPHTTTTSGAGRSHSPVSISSYSSTQSLPARILPRLPREDELERLKQHIAAIGKQLEIQNAELRKIHRRNPSARHHIPMRGPRGELISPEGRVLSTPEAPNRAELAKYQRFFDKLPEPHFRRLMHEMLEYKHMVKQKEEEIKRLNSQCGGLRKRLLRLAQQAR